MLVVHADSLSGHDRSTRICGAEQAFGVIESTNVYAVIAKSKVFKFWPTLALTVGLLVASAAASFTVGHVGAAQDGEFDWALAMDAGIAFGTLALAAFTGALAYATSGDVSATRELTDLTRRDIESRDRPTVLVQIAVFEGASSVIGGGLEGTFRVVLRNVGLGPAFRLRLSAGLDMGTATARITPLEVLIPSLSPGVEEHYTFRFITESQDLEITSQNDRIRVTGTYEDSTLEPDRARPIIDLRHQIIRM